MSSSIQPKDTNTSPGVSAGSTCWRLRNLFSVGVGVIVMTGAIVLLRRGQMEPPPKFAGNIQDIVPTAASLPDWKVIDAPIAETPEIQRQVDELLNFDDAVFRIYEKNGLRISVYLAYWRPGKMQTKDIARHTPDICWVAAGWERTLQGTLNDLCLCNGAGIPMTEYRIFKAKGQLEHVVFWHVVDENTHSYKTGGLPPWYWIITDTLRWRSNQRPEQFFLRISSNHPLPEFWETDLVQEVVGKVPGILHSIQ